MDMPERIGTGEQNLLKYQKLYNWGRTDHQGKGKRHLCVL